MSAMNGWGGIWVTLVAWFSVLGSPQNVGPQGERVRTGMGSKVIGRRFGRQPTAHHRLHTGRVGVDAFQLAELPGSRQLACKRKVR